MKLNPTILAIALVALALIGLSGLASAQTARDLVLEVTATTSGSSPYITLNWPAASGFTVSAQKLWRRTKGSSSWGTAITLGASDISYPDSTALPGVVYEYSLQRTRSGTPSTAYGGIVAGYNVPLAESRGNVCLLVDQTLVTALGPELTQLVNDLTADGWTVYRHDVPRATVSSSSLLSSDWPNRIAEQTNIRTIVKTDYNTAPTSEWALLIVGHIPVVYSGLLNPDGHPEHYGAWPTDGYYADVDGVWTDSSVNYISATDARNRNQPSDGKLDQTSFPSAIELQVGRVDLSSMAGVPTGQTEVGLLRQYLYRDHRFRKGIAPYDNVAARAMFDDNFGYFGGEAFSYTSWSGAIGFFGRNSGQVDSVDWFTTIATTPVLFGFGAGGGSYTSAGGVGTSTLDFGRKDSKAVFTALFGSYFGDWDISNNFLRSPLAGTQDSLGLTCMWSGRGQYHFHHMAMGETIGYCLRFTQNAPSNLSNGDWFQNYYVAGVQTNLMGDPTLRLHTVRPPTGLSATSGSGVQLAWLYSPDSVSGYHVYRATSPSGPFTRLSGTAPTSLDPLGSPISGRQYTDAAVTSGTTYYYQVKAVRLETSQSGSYANQSLGEMTTITYGAATPAPPTRLVVVGASSSSCNLTWDDNATNETNYEVQRRDEPTGAWSTIATLAPGSTAYSDTNAVIGTTNHYRVRAIGVSGNSSFSDEVGDPNQTGIVRIAQDYVLIPKSTGTLNYGITRFSGSLGAGSVNWGISNVVSTAADYSGTAGTMNWAHGQATTQNASISITNYGTPQLSKVFRVDLSGQTGAVLGSPTTGYVQIYDPATQYVVPSGWFASTVGTVTQSGFTEYYNGSFGMCAVTGNIAGTADSYNAFHKPVIGDCRIIARLAARSTAASATRAGIMIRSGAATDDVMCAMVTTSASAIQRAYRTTTAATADTATSQSGLALPLWMRLTRTGDNVALEYSSNGTAWTAFGTPVTLSGLGTSPYVSLVMASNTSAPEIYGYAQFDNVTVNTVPSAPIASAAVGTQPGQVKVSWPTVSAADSYTIERSTTSGAGYTQVAQVSTNNWTDSNLTIGQTYYYHVRASNATYQSSFSTEVSAQPYNPPTVDGWRYRKFGTSANVGNAADTADPDGDGLLNLVECILGLSPTTPTSPSPLTSGSTAGSGSNYLTLTFPHDPSITGVQLQAESAADLAGPWTSFDPLAAANQVSLQPNTPSAGLETIKIKDPVAVSPGGNRFLRLRITRP